MVSPPPGSHDAAMDEGWPPWPATAPRHGSVVLREFRDVDVHVALELSRDPYVPLIGTLPADATPRQAEAWIARQQGRLAEGRGFSFAIADAGSDRAVGQCAAAEPIVPARRRPVTVGAAVAQTSRVTKRITDSAPSRSIPATFCTLPAALSG